MAKQIEVVSVGPDIHVPGGISRVIEMISTRVPARVKFRHIPTFTRYTGAEGLDPSQRGGRLGQSVIYARAFTAILRAAVGGRAIFHVHFAGRGSLIRKGLLCGVLRTLRCTYAVHSHAAEPDLFQRWVPQFCRRLLLWGLSGANRVIVLTEFWRNHYASLLKLPSNRLLLLPNPADLPDAVPERLNRPTLNLLFLGRVGERKGAFDVIRAFAQLPEDVRDKCSLTLAGDGEVDAAALLARQSGCFERVTIRGWVDAKEVKALLRDADVLLLPSYAEGMSMALIEAMSWALAVVTTKAGGAQEFLDHGRNSVLVTPGDVAGISHAIVGLYRNPRDRSRLGFAARETISQFSIDGYMARLSAMYEELAGVQCGEHGAAKTSADHATPLIRHPAETGSGEG